MIDIIIFKNLFMMLVSMLQIFIPLFVWVVILKAIFNAIRRKNNYNFFKSNIAVNKEKKKYIDVSKSKLAEFNTDDINTLKNYFYNMFLDFENAYNNLDYNVMKMLSTKQLFQNYYTGISLNLKVGKKRVINNIERKKVIIYELDSTIAKQVVSAMIEITYNNYMLDKQGYIISGNRDKKITEKFEVVFRKDFDRKDIKNCINCGAEIIGNKCSYCRSIVKNEEFKISSIKKIVDN